MSSVLEVILNLVDNFSGNLSGAVSSLQDFAGQATGASTDVDSIADSASNVSTSVNGIDSSGLDALSGAAEEAGTDLQGIGEAATQSGYDLGSIDTSGLSNVSTTSKEANTNLETTKTKTKETKTEVGELGTAASGLKGIVGGLVGIGIASWLTGCISKAEQSKDSWASYNAVLTQHGGTLGTAKTALSGLANQYGYTTGDIRDGSEALMMAGESYTDVTKKNGDLTAAMGLAAAKGTTVASASKQLQLAYMGNGKALKSLGLDVADYTDKSTGQVDKEKLNAAIIEKTSGKLDEHGKSYEGMKTRMTNALGKMQVSLGTVFLPVVSAVIEGLTGLLDWFNKLPGGIQTTILALAGIVSGGLAALMIFNSLKGVLSPLGGLFNILAKAAMGESAAQDAGVLAKTRAIASMVLHKAASLASAAASGIVTAAQWLLNAAMSANPIALVVIAIVALIAILGYLYNNNETVRNAINGLWDVMKSIGGFISGVLVGAFQALYGILLTVWNAITGFASGAGSSISNFASTVGSTLMSLPGTIWNILVSVVTKVAQWATQMIDKARAMALGFLSNIITQITQLPGKLWNLFWMVIIKIGLFERQMIAKALELARGVLNNIVNTIRNLPGQIWNFLSQTVSKIGSAAGSAASKAKSLAMGILNGIKNNVSQVPGMVYTEMCRIPQRILDSISAVTSMAAKLGDALVAAVKKSLGIGSPGYVYYMVEGELERVVKHLNEQEGVIGKAAGKVGSSIVDNFMSATDLSDSGVSANISTSQKVEVTHTVDLKNVPDSVDETSLKQFLKSALKDNNVVNSIDRALSTSGNKTRRSAGG